ncbi:hypothetical protein GCM10017688_06260 [Streptomyces ramulosus]
MRRVSAPPEVVRRLHHHGLRRRLPDPPGKRYPDWKLDDPAGQGVEAVRPIRDEIRKLIEGLIEEIAPRGPRPAG